MNTATPPTFQDPRDCPIQMVFTRSWQLGRVLKNMLAYSGKAEVTITTFSLGEPFLRALVLLREKNLISYARLFVDHYGASRRAEYMPLLKSAFDEIHLISNHSKILIIEGTEQNMILLTSQNTTSSEKHEAFLLLAKEEIIKQTLDVLDNMQTFRL